MCNKLFKPNLVKQFFCTYTFAEDSKEDSVKEPTVALECGTIKSGVGYVAIQIGDSVYLIKINCDTEI